MKISNSAKYVISVSAVSVLLAACTSSGGSSLAPTLSRMKKARGYGLFGGEGGIRTHETLIAFSGFQDRRFQPLSHLSTPR